MRTFSDAGSGSRTSFAIGSACYSRSRRSFAWFCRQCCAPLVIWAFTLLWCSMAAASLSPAAALWLLSMIITVCLAGDAFFQLVPGSHGLTDSWSARISAGFLLTAIVCYVACLVLPFGLMIDWIVIMLTVIAVWIVAKRRAGLLVRHGVHSSEILFTALALIAVTLWCQDLLRPMELRGDQLILRAWADVYFHLGQIRALASSTGLASMSDIQMAGAAAHPYHFASYMLPAVMAKASGSSAMVAYAGFLVPCGLLLTALAAYALSLSVFGRWPALASGLAVLLLPDALQQGFGNPYFSYHWLQQIAPASSYGVACAALAVMFMLQACKTANFVTLGLSYCFLICTLFFKAQVFVALSFLIWIFPALFMQGFRVRYRLVLLALLLTIYFSVIAVGQTLPSVPVMRFDGSGIASYSKSVMYMQTDGFIKQSAAWSFQAMPQRWLLQAGISAVLILLCTFGVFTLVYSLQMTSLRKRLGAAVACLPVAVVFVYLAMALGLALDDRHIGTTDELIHRPFVWPWFLLAIWIAASAWLAVFGDTAPQKHRTKALLLAVAMCLMAVPGFFANEIQTLKIAGWGWREIPVCKFKAAEFIRMHGLPGDLVQDALNDPDLSFIALTERQAFAVDSGGIRLPDGLSERLKSLKQLKTVTDTSEVETFMKSHKISWYVIGPKADVAWEKALKTRQAFQCGEFGKLCITPRRV